MRVALAISVDDLDDKFVTVLVIGDALANIVHVQTVLADRLRLSCVNVGADYNRVDRHARRPAGDC